ncbi:hypothetical protein HAX54_039806 [Datura stramonium]|uniref:Uncharacterized protein n=1 Tax=Datura stramonium TaxID=4076 RepID=A0ABS8SJN3_DATST|nr:hypothetical protein [Datura stramonium]
MTEKIQGALRFVADLSFDDGGDGFFYCLFSLRLSRMTSLTTGFDEDDLFNVDGGYTLLVRRISVFSDYYSEIRLRYVMGVQVMIQMQCKALVEKFNVSPLIVGIAGPIWLRLLAHEKIMSDEWADQCHSRDQSLAQGGWIYNETSESYAHSKVGSLSFLYVFSERNQLGVKHCDILQVEFPSYTHLSFSKALIPVFIAGEIEISQPTGSKKTEPHNFLGKRAVTIWHKSLKQHDSVALSSWVSSRSCPISTSRMFRPIKAITLQKLGVLAASIARKIGLELPSVNFHAIASVISSIHKHLLKILLRHLPSVSGLCLQSCIYQIMTSGCLLVFA